VSPAEVGYIAASGAACVSFAAGAVIIRSAVRELASVLRDGSQAGYTATLNFALKPPARPKDGEFTADASRFQSALDEALEGAARDIAGRIAHPPEPASAAASGPTLPPYEPIP
jgi:hypothetical protein